MPVAGQVLCTGNAGGASFGGTATGDTPTGIAVTEDALIIVGYMARNDRIDSPNVTSISDSASNNYLETSGDGHIGEIACVTEFHAGSPPTGVKIQVAGFALQVGGLAAGVTPSFTAGTAGFDDLDYIVAAITGVNNNAILQGGGILEYGNGLAVSTFEEPSGSYAFSYGDGATPDTVCALISLCGAHTGATGSFIAGDTLAGSTDTIAFGLLGAAGGDVDPGWAGAANAAINYQFVEIADPLGGGGGGPPVPPFHAASRFSLH